MRPLYGNAPDPCDPDWQSYYKERRQELELIFNSEDPPELGWLVEGLLPGGYLTVLTGRPQDGKTSLVAAIVAYNTLMQRFPWTFLLSLPQYTTLRGTRELVYHVITRA